MKYYILQMRKRKLLTLGEFRRAYLKVILLIFENFYRETLKSELVDKFKLNTKLAVELFLDFKFKKNHHSVFKKLIDFIKQVVYKRGDNLFPLKNKIAENFEVDVFFELKDILMHDKRFSNRNPENIMRLCLNICKKMRFLDMKVQPIFIKIIKLSLGDLDELEFFLRKLLKRDVKVSYVLSAVRWCEDLIKGNQQKKELQEKRRVNARINVNKNATFLHELTATDQLVFLKNLAKRGVAYVELFSFF